MSDSPNLGLPFIEAAQAQKHVTHNEALVHLDALVQAAVDDMAAASPPSEPSNGTRVVVGAEPDGAFSGRAGKIAYFDEGAWRFANPRDGWLVWSSADACPFVFANGHWTKLEASIRRLQNLALLGVETSADAANPLSMRGQNALFTARYSSDGGDGDLRFKLNKESVGATVSQLYQSNWSGRAETGLCGDDSWSVRRSQDGVNWTTALIVDSAQVAAPAGSQAAPGLAFIGDPDTGLHCPASNTLALVAGGQAQARFSPSSANIGGTANCGRLTVQGGELGASTSSLALMTAGGASGQKADLAFYCTFENSGDANPRRAADIVAGFNGSSWGSQFLAFHVGNGASPNDPAAPTVEQVRITRHGLGIGTGAPAEKLHVYGNVHVSGGDRTIYNRGNNYLALGTNNVERMRIAHDGKVGVGAVPYEHFEVGHAGGARLAITDGGGASRKALLMQAPTASQSWARLLAYDYAGAAGLPLVLQDTGQGNVGVAVNNPTVRLHVNGPIRCGSYTRTTLPSAAAVGAGTMIWVTNPASGAARAFWSIGTDWRDQANVAA